MDLKKILLVLLCATPLFGQIDTNWTTAEKQLARIGNITHLNSITVDSATVAGVDTFVTTATADTVVISGALATDLYFVVGRGGSVDQQDVLQVEAKADTLIVHRLASGASALVYNWLRIRYYN